MFKRRKTCQTSRPPRNVRQKRSCLTRRNSRYYDASVSWSLSRSIASLLPTPVLLQVDRHNLDMFVGLLGDQVQYLPFSRDIFVRMHDGQVERVKEGTASPAICYIDGVSGPLPTLYVEKSGRRRPWFTRTHNEFGCLTFLNLMSMAGRAEEDFLDLLQKDPEAVWQARKRMDGFKVKKKKNKSSDTFSLSIHHHPYPHDRCGSSS